MSNVKIITKLLYISKVKGEAVISESSNYLDYMKKGGILEKIDDDQLRDQNGEVSMDFNGSKSARLEDFVSEIEERTRKRLEIFKDPYKKFEDIQNQEIMKYCKEKGYNPLLAQSRYNQYIAGRKGSSGVFTNFYEDIDEMTDELSRYKGTVYLPIVSMKEEDATEYGLNGIADWKKKTEKFVEEYAKIMKWDVEKTRYLAAYHEKEILQQRKDSVAGSQPHIHFMIWYADQDFPRCHERLNKGELTQLRRSSASVFLSEGQQKLYYMEENEKSQIKHQFEYAYEADFSRKLVDLHMEASRAFNHQGRCSTKTIENHIEMLTRLLYRQREGLNINQKQIDFLKRLGCTDSYYDIYNKLQQFGALQKRSVDMVNDFLKSPAIRKNYHNWLDIKYEITSKYENDDIAREQTRNSDSALKSILMNNLLSFEDDWFSIEDIGPEMKKSFLERVDKYQFPKYLKDDDTLEALKRIAEVLVTTTHLSDDEIQLKIERLVNTSRKDLARSQYNTLAMRCRFEKMKKPLIMQKYDFYKTYDLINNKVVDIEPPYWVTFRRYPYPFVEMKWDYFYTNEVDNLKEHEGDHTYKVPWDIFR